MTASAARSPRYLNLMNFLFQILSNVHTVRATWSQNSPKLWTFSPRVSRQGGNWYGGWEFGVIFQSAQLLPSILDGACVVRSDQTHSNLGILFELCVTYIRAVSVPFSIEVECVCREIVIHFNMYSPSLQICTISWLGCSQVVNWSYILCSNK